MVARIMMNYDEYDELSYQNRFPVTISLNCEALVFVNSF